MIDQNIKSKIVKMLTLANDKGASEDEAATAMRMAMGLMAKHGIDQSMLADVKDKPKAKIGTWIKNKFKRHQVTLASAAGALFGCRVVMYGKNGADGIQFIGRPDNIEASETTLFFLIRQVEALYRSALPPGMSQKERAEYRRTFKDACAGRVRMRAAILVREMQTNDSAAKGATGQNALVVKGYFDGLLAEADDQMKEMSVRTVKSKPRKMGSGSIAGMQAGDKVKLRHEVGQ